MQPQLSKPEASFWESVRLTIAIALAMTFAGYSIDLLFGESPTLRSLIKDFGRCLFFVVLLRWAIPRFQYQPK